MKQRQIKAPDMPLAPLNAPPRTKTVTPHPPAALPEAEPSLQPHVVERIAERFTPAAGAFGGDGGEWLMIPLSRLKIHPFNSRTQRTQERIEEVRDMLEAEHKQREPITVVPGRKPEDAGFFYILSGQTRYHAANLAGWAELKSQINADIDPEDHLVFFAASIEHNTSRPETDWDLAVKVCALLEEGSDLPGIQKAVRRDERGLRRLMAMSALPEQVLQVVRENPTKLTASVCEVLKSAVADLGDEAAASFAREVVEKELSRRSLQEHIERAIRRKSKVGRGAKRATRQFMLPIVVGTDKAGEFKVMQSRNEGNRLVSLTADLPEDFIETFKTDIEAAIAKLARKQNEG